MGEGGVEFIFEGFGPDGGAAAACSCGVAALEHEIPDGAVEGDVVVVAFFCELDEIPDGFGGVFGQEFEGEGAVGGRYGGVAGGFYAAGFEHVGFVGEEGEGGGCVGR